MATTNRHDDRRQRAALRRGHNEVSALNLPWLATRGERRRDTSGSRINDGNETQITREVCASSSTWNTARMAGRRRVLRPGERAVGSARDKLPGQFRSLGTKMARIFGGGKRAATRVMDAYREMQRDQGDGRRAICDAKLQSWSGRNWVFWFVRDGQLLLAKRAPGRQSRKMPTRPNTNTHPFVPCSHELQLRIQSAAQLH